LLNVYLQKHRQQHSVGIHTHQMWARSGPTLCCCLGNIWLIHLLIPQVMKESTKEKNRDEKKDSQGQGD